MRLQLPYRWELVLWLSLAFFFNQADRQVFHVVMPLLKADLGLTDLQLGGISSLFSAVLALTAPLAGYAGDAFSRTRIVTGSLFGWSLACLLTGFAPGFMYLIVVRSVATGVGEGLHAPAAYALISQYHTETRGRAMAVHQTSVYVGLVASGVLAGYLGQYYGWRNAFWVFGGLGMVLAAVLAGRLRELPRPTHPAARFGFRAAVAALCRTPTAALLSAAFCAMVFVNIACLTWMPTYLHERFGLNVGAAGFMSMFYLNAAALGGVLTSGRLSDRLAHRSPRFRASLQAAGLLGGAPFLYLLSQTANLAVACAALAGAGLFRGVYEANIYAALHDVTPARYHATASSAMISIAYLLGCIAPVGLGAVKQQVGLGWGVAALSAILAAGALAAFLASRFCYLRDHAYAAAH